jgi:hypothetical protein
MFNYQHPLYATWIAMRQRCNTTTAANYRFYGQRGITVCERWDDFNLFVEDMGERPEGHTLDRINFNGNYEPSNCRWADRSTQAINKRLKALKHLDPMRCVYSCGSKYYVQIRLVPRTRPHQKHFNTIDEALEYRDLLDYERTFYRALIK